MFVVIEMHPDTDHVIRGPFATRDAAFAEVKRLYELQQEYSEDDETRELDEEHGTAEIGDWCALLVEPTPEGVAY